MGVVFRIFAKAMTIAQISGDSTVQGFSYEAGVAEFQVIDGETGDHWRVRVPTRLFYSETTTESGSVHFRIFPLASHLQVHQPSGRYISPESFEEQMQASRKGLHLAYGLPAAEFPLFFCALGYSIIFACPLSSEAQITVTPIEAH